MKFEFFCIVEGYGEVKAVPVLLRRLQALIRPDVDLYIHQPHRISRTKLLRMNELERAVKLANLKLTSPGAVLLLLDADDDLPCKLGPFLLERMSKIYRVAGIDISVVVANREFEAWFLAGYNSPAGHRGLAARLDMEALPESIRDAKGVFARQLRGKYSPPLDQPAFAGKLDLGLTRQHSPSFDKLWRDVETLLRPL